MSPSIVRMSNVVVDTVLYIHVRDFAPARGMRKNAVTANFKKNTFVKKIAFLYRIE